MEEGFILLSRKLLDSDVFASQKLLKIWIWCLLKANYKDRAVPLKIGKGIRIVKVKRGQFLFGRFKAENELFIDGSTIYKSIKKLEQMKMITIKSNNQYSIITICNYNTYQDTNEYKVTTKEQPSNNQVTTKEQPSNTNNNVNNVNNVKKDNIEFDIFWNQFHYYTKKPKTDKEPTLKYWRKLSDNEKQKAIDKIEEYSKTNQPKYLKKARTYLADKTFNDEFIINSETQINNLDISILNS